MRTAPIAARCLPAALFGLLATSCSSPPVVEVVLEDPLELRSKATFAQLIVFEGGCPDREKLAAGDVSGNRWMQSIKVAGNFNEIGNLEKAQYGFSAILRNDRCGVMGFGCTPVDLSHHRHVTVAVNELVNPPRGSCEANETCNNSVCVTGSPGEGGVEDVDAGPLTCELELIAAGKFDAPTVAGTLFTGPAVVATPAGFVIMYREATPSGTDPRGVRLKITDEGDATRTNITLPACEQDVTSDGIGAAWNQNFGAGLMAVSLPVCGTEKPSPRLHVSNFDRDGKTLAEYTYDLPSRVILSPVKSMAASPGNNNFLAAAMAGDAPFLYVFDGLSVQQDPAPQEIHKGNGAVTFTQIATATSTRATLTDSDLEGGKLIVTVADTGSGNSSTTSFSRTNVTSLVAWGDRAALIQPSSALLAWHVFTKAGATVKDGTLTGGPYTAMDVAQLHDYLLVAGAQAGSITVFRLDDANGTLSSTSTFQTKLSSSFGGVSLQDFKGERVAIAAARGRVVVTWITSTATIAGTTTAPGGYAVLGCDG
jgi:hypothetical protein